MDEWHVYLLFKTLWRNIPLFLSKTEASSANFVQCVILSHYAMDFSKTMATQ